MDIPYKLGIKLLFDPTIPLLSIHPEETTTERDTCTPMFTAALLTTARTRQRPKCLLPDEWIKKLWYVCTTLLSHHATVIKKNTDTQSLLYTVR